MYAYFLTFVALLAFAANSVLGRLALGAEALGGESAHPVSYTAIRLISGACVLWGLSSWSAKAAFTPSFKMFRMTVLPASLLFGYAITFSFAYVLVPTGSGALLLFGAVQLTMLGFSWLRGGSLSARTMIGTCVAFLGLVYLMLPSAASPSLMGASLMLLSGVFWGAYSLLGVTGKNPLNSTANNFILCLPLCVGLLVWYLIMHDSIEMSRLGVVYAVASGGLASALGYALWYKILPILKGANAATLQLLVPVLAALGGVIFVGEEMGWRLLVSGAAVLGGVYYSVARA